MTATRGTFDVAFVGPGDLAPVTVEAEDAGTAIECAAAERGLDDEACAWASWFVGERVRRPAPPAARRAP
jgi:hypothetical protein